MATQAPLELIIQVDDKGAVTKVRRLGQELEAAGQKGAASMEKASSSLGSLAGQLGLAVSGVTALAKTWQFMTSSIREAAAAEVEFAKVAAVVKGTGGAAGYTAEQLARMAAEFQRTSVYADETIMQAQAILLTFRSISGAEFPRTIRVAMDLATVMGGDLTGAVMQLGKALENPEVGLMALRRSGVSFSQAETEMIKSLVEANRALEAQRMILDKVEAQLGHPSIEIMQTHEGQVRRLTNTWSDFKEQIGSVALDIVKASSAQGVLTDALEVLNGQMQEHASIRSAVAAVPLYTLFGPVGPVVGLAGAMRELNEEFRLFRSAQRGTLGEVLAAPEVKSAVESTKDALARLVEKAEAVTTNDKEWEKFKTTIRSSLDEGATKSVVTLASALERVNALVTEMPDLKAEEYQRAPWQPEAGANVPIMTGIETGVTDPFLAVIEKLREARGQDLAEHMAYLQQRGVLDMQYYQEQVQRILSERQMQMDLYATVLGGAAQLVQAIGGQNKAAFRLVQLLRLGEVWMHYAAAQMNIMATSPPYAWGPLMTMAKIQAAISAALILAQKPPSAKGFETGTPYVPRTGLYMLHEGERVVPRNVAAQRWGPSDTRALAPNVTLDFSGAFIDDERMAARLASMVGEAMARGWN